ncbi:SRC kinase signaling inhibitor 1 isoform X2 [Strongylocentrotus purpuratus]|uniref:Actin interacting protein 3-like C-terminal domain-containing protein n=1 Tax=Strongylocentrotus purpuratus TaxID=7668 RepID=A0A7M7P685_STRPU|nr:SRC kinase signaling inhibitor 1 isoform X2 [Strongylocentrotus purpuratus]
MEYLKRKYPEHSDRIQGRAAEAPVNGVFCETDLDNMDNMDTMSEINTEATGFSRGGRLRSSMPVIRPTVNMTKERPLGLVYLQYKNETKRGLMPNEVTGIDTVRALYVRAFPKQLNMEMLEKPVRKIYIKDPATEIFYELEDSNEIMDRSVLKIYEPGFVEDPNAPGPSSPRSTTSTPVELDYYSEPEVDHQKRDVRKNRYNTMTLPRNMHFMQTQEGEGAKPAPAGGSLNPSPEKKQSQSMENFRRGVPERSSASLQRPAAHTQAFQRLTPERATLGGPVSRGGPGGPHPHQGPYGRRGQPYPGNQPQQHGGSSTMPRRMPPPSGHEGGPGPGMGPRPQGGSSTMPRQHQRGGQAVVDGGSRPGSRPSSADMVSRSQNSTPVTKVMQNQVMSAPMPNGHPRQRGAPPQHHRDQTPPGRPLGGQHATLPRNGAPGMRQPIPNGMGPQHRGQPPLRRHGSHDGTFSHGSERISAMEQQIANLAGMVRSVIGTHNGAPRQGRPQQEAAQRPPNDRPTPPMRTDSAQVQARTPTPQQQQQQQQPPPQSRTPVPQQPPARPPGPQSPARPPGPQSPRPSSHPGTGVTGRPGVHPGGVNVQRCAMVLKHRTTDLRMQLKQIRKMHLNMVQQVNNNFRSTSHKIRLALEGAPGTDSHPIRNQRARVHQEYIKYLQTQEMIERDLRILDENVDKLREKTINNRGSVDMDSLEQQAQVLGNCSRGIAEQKVNFPVLSEKLKTVQEGEMEVVVREENWMKHEPQRLDDHFKRCKKITSTLYTLKRMAATNDEPYVVSPSSPTIAPTITPTVTASRQVVRVESAPLPTSSEAKRETVESYQDDNVRHDLPHRFRSPMEQDQFEHTLSGKREDLRRTNNVEANQTRQRNYLRELFDQENHDSMTPIITPEKAAKREAQKEAAGVQKKGPPPPPPPRKHFPASPASPEQANKKISWSSSTSTSQPKVPSEEVVVGGKVESESEAVVESMPEPESESQAVKDRVGDEGDGGAGGHKTLSNASSTSAGCLINAVTAAVDPPPITSTTKAHETSKSTPSLGATEFTTPKEINGSFHSQTLVTVGNGGVAHSNGKVGKDKSHTKRSFLSRSPSKSGQQGSSSNSSVKSKSKKMGGALARLLRRDHEKGDSSQKANSPSPSEVGPPPKPPRGCMDSPTTRAKKILVTAASENNINNNAKQITIPEKPGQRSGQVTNQGRMAKSAENICLSSSPENDMYPPEGIYNVQRQQIIQDPNSTHSSPVRSPVFVSISGPRRTQSDSAGQLPRASPSSVEIKRRETDPAVRPKTHQPSASAGNDENLRTIQLKAQYAKLRQMQLQNVQRDRKAVQIPDVKQVNGPNPQPLVIAISKPTNLEDNPTAATDHNKPTELAHHGSSPTKKEIKSPPPVAAKPSARKSIKTTTTTVTTQSYQLADVNQALDDLESLMVKATDTDDMDDSNVIQESTPSSPNGTIQKPVHAHIRLPQSPPRSFATKPKPLSPKGEAAKVGGKSSAFKPIKKASLPTTNSAVASLSISLSQPSKAPSSPNKAAKSDKSGQSQETVKPQSENSALSAVKSPDEKRAVRIVVTEAEADIKQTTVGDAKSRVNDVNAKDAGEKEESEHSDKDININLSGKTTPTKTDLDSSTQSNVTNGHSDGGEQNPEDERVSKTNVTDVNDEKKVVKSAAVDDSTKSDYVTEIKTTFVNGIIEETFIN